MNVFRRWKIVRIFMTALYLMGGWLLFTGTVAPAALLLGLFFSTAVALLSYHLFIEAHEAERRAQLRHENQQRRGRGETDDHRVRDEGDQLAQPDEASGELQKPHHQRQRQGQRDVVRRAGRGARSTVSSRMSRFRKRQETEHMQARRWSAASGMR